MKSRNKILAPRIVDLFENHPALISASFAQAGGVVEKDIQRG